MHHYQEPSRGIHPEPAYVYIAGLLILQRLDSILLALNLALLLLNLRLSLGLFVLPVLHRVANERAAEQAEATADRRTGARIAR